jgi:hypothetical protein
MGRLTPRTQEQREWIAEQRVRAIETGEWMEKLGLHESLGMAPPIGANFHYGESTQDLRNRAARAGIYLPGKSSPVIDTMVQGRKTERETGVSAYAMPIKDRFGISSALFGFSSWEIPDLVEYDYAYLNLAGITTFPGGVIGIIPGTNANLIGSPDSIGDALTVASASRVVGSGKIPYFIILSCWVFARTAAGAVYNPAAGTTMQPFVVSAGVAATQIATALSAAALNLATLTTFWTQIALVAPADRVIQKLSGTGAQAGIVAGYFSDFLLSTLVTTGAVNVQGNSLITVFELA